MRPFPTRRSSDLAAKIGEGNSAAELALGQDARGVADQDLAAAHGGQILVSDATRILAQGELRGGITFADLGSQIGRATCRERAHVAGNGLGRLRCGRTRSSE